MRFVFPEMGKEVAELFWLRGAGAKSLFQPGKMAKKQPAGRGNGGLGEDGPLEDWSGIGDNVH